MNPASRLSQAIVNGRIEVTTFRDHGWIQSHISAYKGHKSLTECIEFEMSVAKIKFAFAAAEKFCRGLADEQEMLFVWTNLGRIGRTLYSNPGILLAVYAAKSLNRLHSRN